MYRAPLKLNINTFNFLSVHKDLGNTDSYYNDENLVSTVGNLFVAGTDTTATTLRWCLLFMAKYPHLQGDLYACIQPVWSFLLMTDSAPQISFNSSMSPSV